MKREDYDHRKCEDKNKIAYILRRKKLKSRITIFAAVIVFVLLTLLLSGCTGEKKTGETNGSIQKEAVDEAGQTQEIPIPNSLISPELKQKIDISKIEIYPREGEYLSSGPYNKIALFGGNKETTYLDAKMLLLNYSLNYITLQEVDTCMISANPGDSGIVMRGTLKNEYDRDYWVIISAAAYDSNENLIEGVLDSGPVCGMIARHIESNKTENIELHFKYNNTISKINLSGWIGDVCPS